MVHTTEFSTIQIDKLYRLIDSEFNTKKEIFGIPEALFFNPTKSTGIGMQIFNQQLHTPIGVAAGPHSQMAQNIIVAWLCGASYIELKTIQTLDELSISKPCIDMQDEGYNCEWSQELHIHESFEEYLKAWIIIHLLQHKLGLKKGGFIFNMSIGYNYEGILKENVQWFLDNMRNCSETKKKFISILAPLYPAIHQLHIPDCLSNNITLSTMHGCPPDEIEKIGHYLLSEKKIHTFIKLNPTLLGKEALREILNNKLGFKNDIPDQAFEHDLKFKDAIGIIRRLQNTADQENLEFGLKLTNTLESVNHKDIFPEHEKMMYMSGRALHPISINVARKLQNEFNGSLNISFSGGADCFNIKDILHSGLKPVTVSSDLLKPGGYGRLHQYIENIIDDKDNPTIQPLQYLNSYADAIVSQSAYKADPYTEKNIKSARNLGQFDCIHAPCVDECPTNQDIPEYMYYASKGDFQKALDVILAKNPFPNVLGSACDHICQAKCTRINYDQSLKIREIKLFIAGNGKSADIIPAADNGYKVAIIGAGPSGLSCAYFLRLAGFEVEIFESKPAAGGMVYDAIPGFRMKMNLLERDIERIKTLGVKIHYHSKIDRNSFDQLRKEYSFVYIAAGAQRFKSLQMESDDAAGVLDAFEFLKKAKNGTSLDLGKNILVIGGGNTAMDVARTAKRLAGNDASVKVLYRRTRGEMPADREEIEALFHENIELLELLSPEKIHVKDGRITSLSCAKMKLEQAGKGNRPKPVKTGEPLLKFAADTLIPALGQEIDIQFASQEELKTKGNSYETTLKNVFIGGDALRGAATIVKAVGDGRKTAVQIAAKAGVKLTDGSLQTEKDLTPSELLIKKSTRINIAPEISGYKAITQDKAARAEASRCLLCNEICNVCVSVCPNRANTYYHAEAAEIPVWKIDFDEKGYKSELTGNLSIHQKIQVLNIADFCNECGNCTTFCPTAGQPFKDKPRFCLTKKSFDQTQNSYLLQCKNQHLALLHRNGDIISSMIKNDDGYLYNTPEVEISFNLHNFSVTTVKIKEGYPASVFLKHAAEMKFLIDNVSHSFICQTAE